MMVLFAHILLSASFVLATYSVYDAMRSVVYVGRWSREGVVEVVGCCIGEHK